MEIGRIAGSIGPDGSTRGRRPGQARGSPILSATSSHRWDQAPKITRVPVDGITSFAGMAWCTATMVLSPVQCMGMM